MDEQKRPASPSRFGESVGRQRPTGNYRTQPAGSYRSRPGYQPKSRPTGFGNVGAAKEKPRPEPSETKIPKKQKDKNKEQKRYEQQLRKEHRRAERKHGEKSSRRGLKALLIVIGGMLVLAIALVILFGNSTEGYHQLPTITRQEEEFPAEEGAENTPEAQTSAVSEVTS